MRKIIFFGTAILLLCVAVWGIYKVMKPHRNVDSDEAVASISATALYTEFLKSENLATQKWVGKVIEIRGTIASINETGDYISINLHATDEGGINCNVLKKDLQVNEKYNKGDVVTIKGKCTGFLMDVNMVDCVIMK